MSRAPYNALILPYRQDAAVREYAIFYCTGGSMCQFLAGGGDVGEEPLNAAKREAYEEAGIEEADDRWFKLDAIASIPRDAFPNAPWPDHIHVIPEYAFAVHVASVDFTLSHEHERYEWLIYEKAIAALTWDSNRVALYELNRHLQITAQQDATTESVSRPP